MKKSSKYIYIYILIGIVFYLMILYKHFSMSIISDDAVNIEKKIYAKSVIQIIKTFYYSNSRVFCDTLAHLLYRIDFKIWKIIDSFIWLFIDILITIIFTDRKICDFIFVSILILLFPIDILSSAGYIATSSNYIYTIFAMLIILLVLKSTKEENKISAKNLIPIFFIPYVTNQDQTAFALILILIFILLVNFLNQKKRNAYNRITTLYLLFAIICYLFYFNMPGHKARAEDYLSPFSVPNYVEWSFFDKIYHGFTSTIAYIFYDKPFIIIMFSLLLAFYHISTMNKERIILSFVPIIYEAFVHVIGKSFFTVKYDYTYELPEIGQLNVKNITILLVTIFILFLYMYLILKIENKLKYMVLFGCILGFLTRMAMGFSRTLYGSSFRTFTFFYFSIMCSMTMLFNTNTNKNKYLCILLCISMLF